MSKRAAAVDVATGGVRRAANEGKRSVQEATMRMALTATAAAGAIALAAETADQRVGNDIDVMITVAEIGIDTKNEDEIDHHHREAIVIVIGVAVVRQSKTCPSRREISVQSSVCN